MSITFARPHASLSRSFLAASRLGPALLLGGSVLAPLACDDEPAARVEAVELRAGECPCDGGKNHLGQTVDTDECGYQVCGEDFKNYVCGADGWEFQGGTCGGDDGCDCPGGKDFRGDTVHATECNHQVCGENFKFYTCQPSGWVQEGGACDGDGGEVVCDCPDGTNNLGQTVHATECGQTVCGQNFEYYSCELTGWVSQGGVCGGDDGCDCPGGKNHLGQTVHATECDVQVCGENLQYYVCGQDGWVQQGGPCDG
ncbi:hypothetical protein [Nannocystis bainbridge]|uniref:EGF-like domain-containing protein n=1 Tax=Nannocystis bainbridge TaxID=2995303 RepID=A0ABT5E5R3_9BACT|nr:hypothetical protein [Nannocystis bainbridge]MDC0721195.1 hypothetical protein [Nannocystis bainbridge]